MNRVVILHVLKSPVELIVSSFDIMIIRIVTFVLLIGLNNNVIGQELTTVFGSDNNKLILSKTDSYSLSEDSFFVSNILDVSAINDEIILSLDSEPGVLKYFDQGKKQVRVGNFGRGPFEYLKANIVYQSQESKAIYIWDASQLKLSKFNSQAEGLEEFKDFRWSWGDFELLDNHIYIYNKGRSSGKYIQKFDLESSKIIDEYGKIDQTHAFLKIYEGSGGITKKDDFIYFISPSSLKINKLDTRDNSIFTESINDDDFVVPDIDNAFEIIQQGKDKIIELMRETSVVTDLHAVDDYILIMTQVGKQTYNSDAGFYTLEDKKVKIYVLDIDSLQFLDSFTFSVATHRKIQDKYWTSNGSHLIYISKYSIGSENNDIEQPNFVVNYFQIESQL